MVFRGLPLILFFFYIHGLYRQTDEATNPQEVATLRALQQAWGQDKLPWNGDPCESRWLGVNCDSTNTRIDSLSLPNMQLEGELPDDIGQLASLTTLDLSFNPKLSGSLPSQLGNLGRLIALILQSCNFSGSIPSEIGKLKNLTYLALNGNSLSGAIPPDLGFLKDLYWLDLASNKLSGTLPASSDGNKLKTGLDNLTTARHFHLSNNSFSGSIPREIFNENMNLFHLLLDSNQLSGFIPEEIGLLRNLTIIKLDHNQLTGKIPPTVSQLGATLYKLQLNNNSLSGPLPDLTNFSKLYVLDLTNNSFETTEVPSWFSSLASLASLVMEGGNLIGQISPDVFSLPQLEAVKLDSNYINGTLPLENAGKKLQLISVKHNNIKDVRLGAYKKTLLLQGNPACNNGNYARVCHSPDSPSEKFSGNSCNVNCRSGLELNPRNCFCTNPFKGFFLCRAPLFTEVNVTQINSLIPVIVHALNLSNDQVDITNASFDIWGYLKVDVSFFPRNKERWSQMDIQSISAILGNPNRSVVYPHAFGPISFQPYPYDSYVDTSGAGLGMGVKIGIAIGAATLVSFVFVACMCAFLQKHRAEKALQMSMPFDSWGVGGRESGDAPKLKGARWFSYDELKKATNNFSKSNEIGAGGYGKVYRGILLSGEEVAIKRAEEAFMQDATEFKNAIELLSRVHHKNLVNLIGFCFERGQQMLIYEYMTNGTLQDNLLVGCNDLTLDWQRRILIALGSARAISYLHQLADPPIIHRNIKSSNILLDKRKSAKVADFSLPKVGPDYSAEKDHVSTQVKGTPGYLDPEYYLTQQLTEKSDVYSFGIVLLELLTARQPIQQRKYIVHEVRTALNTGGIPALQSLLDPNLKDYSLEELTKFLDLALRCVNEAAANRPRMNEVVKELESLVGHVYPDSESVHGDAAKSSQDPYAGIDEWVRKKNLDSSFQYSGGISIPTIKAK